MAALLLAALTLIFVLHETEPESEADLVAAVDADESEATVAGKRDQSHELISTTVGGDDSGVAAKRKNLSASKDMKKLEKVATRRRAFDLLEEDEKENQLKSLGYAGGKTKKGQGDLGELSIRDGSNEDTLSQAGAAVREELSKASESKTDADRTEALARNEKKLSPSELARLSGEEEGFVVGRGARGSPKSGAEDGPKGGAPSGAMSGSKLPGRADTFNCLLVETESDLGEAAKSLDAAQFRGRAVIDSMSHYSWATTRGLSSGELDNAVLLEIEASDYRELLPTLTTSQTVAVYGCVLEDESTPSQRPESEVDKEPSGQADSDEIRLPVLAAVWKRFANEIDSSDMGRQKEEHEVQEESEKVPDHVKRALFSLSTRSDSAERLRFKAGEDLAVLFDEEVKDEIKVNKGSNVQEGIKKRIFVLFVRSGDSPPAGPLPPKKKDD